MPKYTHLLHSYDQQQYGDISEEQSFLSNNLSSATSALLPIPIFSLCSLFRINISNSLQQTWVVVPKVHVCKLKY